MEWQRVKKGWDRAGQLVEVLGLPVEVKGLTWIPVRFEEEEDPEFIKSGALEELPNR